MNKTELREKSLGTAHEARALLDTIKADNSNAAEVESKFAEMMKESDSLALRAENIERFEARENEMNKIDNVSDVKTESRADSSDEEKRSRAFEGYLRGKVQLGELRAMGIAGQDGAITPTSFGTTLLTHLTTEGPMLDPAIINMLVTSTGNTIEMPTFNDDIEAVIIGENTLIPEGDLGFGSKRLGAYKYTSKIVRISNELLQDAAVNVEDIVSKALAKRIGRGVNRHLTVGTGVDQPEGIVTAASVGVTAAAINAVTPEELFAMQHSIDAAYRPSAKWMIPDASLLKFRTMKNTDGTFVWAPGLSVSAPATILGNAYVVNPYMNAEYSTGKVVALYGDLKAYTVRQAKDIFVRRLGERYADYDQTAFVALARMDGALLDTSAVKALKLK